MNTIRTPTEFNLVMTREIARPLLKKLSEQVVEMIQKKLSTSSISTETLQRYTVYSIDESSANQMVSTIYIDDTGVQSTAIPPSNGGFGQFTSLGGETSYAGQNIASWMIEWLENGVNMRAGARYLGNQPLDAVNMFSEVEKELNTKLDSMVISTLSSFGFIVTKK